MGKTEKKHTIVPPIILLVSSILIIMFCFYIDEGFYNFKWMTNAGNWIAFLIYVIPMFIIQLLTYRILNRTGIKTFKTALSILIGTTIALTLVIGMFLLLKPGD